MPSSAILEIRRIFVSWKLELVLQFGSNCYREICRARHRQTPDNIDVILETTKERRTPIWH